MPVVQYEGQHVPLEADESVLDALLRAGIGIAHACRSGICHACIVQIADDSASAPLNREAQAGLSAAQKAQQQVLSCQCKPTADIALTPVGSQDARFSSKVLEKNWLNDHVLGVRLSLPDEYTYRAGQYLTLWHGHQGRCYSIASVLDEDHCIEMQVCVYPDGTISKWLAEEVVVGEPVEISRPAGGCFYQADREQPLLLMASGTGLAPILGVLRDARFQGHTGPMHLVVAARDVSGFYASSTLARLSDQMPGLEVTLVSGAQGKAASGKTAQTGALPIVFGDVYAHVGKQYSDLKGWQVYVCGRDSFVRKLRRQCFMAGAGMRDIFSDSFVSAV